MHCPSCGAENPDDATFCNLCMMNFAAKKQEPEAPVTAPPQTAPPPPDDRQIRVQELADENAAPSSEADAASPLPVDFNRPHKDQDRSVIDSLLESAPAWSPKSNTGKIILTTVACILLLVIAGVSTFVFLSREGKATYKSKITPLQFEYPESWRKSTVTEGNLKSITSEMSDFSMTADLEVALAGTGNDVKSKSFIVINIQNISLSDMFQLASITAESMQNSISEGVSGEAADSDQVSSRQTVVHGDPAVVITKVTPSSKGEIEQNSLFLYHAGDVYVFIMTGENNNKNAVIWQDILISINFK